MVSQASCVHLTWRWQSWYTLTNPPEYCNNSPYSLEEEIEGLVVERDELKKDKLRLRDKKLKLKDRKLRLIKKNEKLQNQRQSLKVKVEDLKTAYHALKHSGQDEDDESLPCSDRCCEVSEDSFDENSSDDD